MRGAFFLSCHSAGHQGERQDFLGLLGRYFRNFPGIHCRNPGGISWAVSETSIIVNNNGHKLGIAKSAYGHAMLF